MVKRSFRGCGGELSFQYGKAETENGGDAIELPGDMAVKGTKMKWYKKTEEWSHTSPPQSPHDLPRANNRGVFMSPAAPDRW